MRGSTVPDSKRARASSCARAPPPARKKRGTGSGYEASGPWEVSYHSG